MLILKSSHLWPLVSNRLICRGVGLKRRVSMFVGSEREEPPRGYYPPLNRHDVYLKSHIDISTLSKRTAKYIGTILSRKKNCSSAGSEGGG
jgi:hypothetical protein